MSKRKYQFTITNIDALAAAYPHAIEETIIPAHVELKVSYAYIAKLLDLNLPVAGIEVAGNDAPDSTPLLAPIKPKTPPALRGLLDRTLDK